MKEDAQSPHTASPSPDSSVQTEKWLNSARESFQKELSGDFGGILNEAQIEHFGWAAQDHFRKAKAKAVREVEEQERGICALCCGVEGTNPHCPVCQVWKKEPSAALTHVLQKALPLCSRCSGRKVVELEVKNGWDEFQCPVCKGAGVVPREWWLALFDSDIRVYDHYLSSQQGSGVEVVHVIEVLSIESSK